jgi:hypothetical protein
VESAPFGKIAGIEILRFGGVGGRRVRIDEAKAGDAILNGRDRKQLSDLPLPRAYNCSVFLLLLLQKRRAVGGHDLSHGISGDDIRFEPKRTISQA